MSKPKIGQTVSIHYNIWLSNESFSSDYYYVGEEGQEKLGEMTTPEYVDSTPETQIVVTSYGEDVLNQQKKRVFEETI